MYWGWGWSFWTFIGNPTTKTLCKHLFVYSNFHSGSNDKPVTMKNRICVHMTFLIRNYLGKIPWNCDITTHLRPASFLRREEDLFYRGNTALQHAAAAKGSTTGPCTHKQLFITKITNSWGADYVAIVQVKDQLANLDSKHTEPSPIPTPLLTQFNVLNTYSFCKLTQESVIFQPHMWQTCVFAHGAQ